MKKIPMFASILLIVGVLASMAFSHPLVVRNGVVRGYSTSSITIVNHDQVMTYFIPQNTTVMPQNAAGSLAAGARVTVVAQCFHGGAKSADNTANNGNQENAHVCVALGLFVRAGAPGAVPATGGTGGTTATGTSTPAAGAGGTTGTGTATAAASSTPEASATSSTGGTGGTTGTGTPAAGVPATGGTGTPGAEMLCPTATATATLGTATVPTDTPTPVAGVATGTATATAPCVTPTP